MNPPIPIGSWSPNQHLLYRFFHIRPPTIHRLPPRSASIVKPTPGHSQCPTHQNQRTTSLLGQPSYIPSGNLKSFSSKTFFKISTSNAFLPKAHSNSSTFRPSATAWLF